MPQLQGYTIIKDPKNPKLYAYVLDGSDKIVGGFQRDTQAKAAARKAVAGK